MNWKHYFKMMRSVWNSFRVSNGTKDLNAENAAISITAWEKSLFPEDVRNVRAKNLLLLELSFTIANFPLARHFTSLLMFAKGTKKYLRMNMPDDYLSGR